MANNITIVGGLGDQLTTLVWSRISDISILSFPIYEKLFFEFLYPLKTNQPLLWLFLSKVLRLLGSNSYNIFIVFTLLANFFVAYLLFKRFNYSYIYAILYTFSSYFWVHLGVHPALMQIWLYPLFIQFLLKDKYTMRHYILLAAIITLSISISNYIGFFLLIFFTLYSFIKFVLVKQDIRQIKRYFIVVVLSGVVSSLFLVPYISNVYLASSNNKHTAVRGYEDFVSFSSRPWYYFLPPVDNPFLGDVSEEVLGNLEKTSYFLADDYFPAEHQASFFGNTLLLFIFTSLIYVVIKRGRLKTLKKELFLWLLIIGVLVSITMPPFFTVSGVTIFTPGWLVAKLFPIFRVTTRASVLILLCLLYILGLLVETTKKLIVNKKLYIVMLHIVFILTLFETFIPLKITKYTDSPRVYSQLKMISNKDYFAAYPYSLNNEAFFWVIEHENALINPRGYKAVNFDSERFTKSLALDSGLEEMSSKGVKYLVVGKNISSIELAHFLASDTLTLQSETDNHLLFEVK